MNYLLFTRLVALLWFAPTHLFAEETRPLPSSATLSVGGDREGAVNTSLNFVLALRSGWLLSFGGDNSKIPDAENQDEVTLSGAHIGLSSNPLQLWSTDLDLTSWRMSDDVKSWGGLLGVNFSPNAGLLRLYAGWETLRFLHLPQVLFAEDESEVRDQYLGAEAEYYWDEKWSLRAFASAHEYNQDLGDYAEGLRVLFMPPSVLTTVSGFPKSEIGMGVGFTTWKFNGGLEISSSRSALDDVHTQRLQLRGSYEISRSWRIGVILGTAKPEDSQEDSRDNRYGSVSFTFLWR